MGDSVELHLYRGNDYDLYPFGKIDSNVVTAELIALKIMELDNNIYGNRKYRVSDSSLFYHNYLGRNKLKGSTIQLAPNSNVAGKYAFYVACFETQNCYCLKHPGSCSESHTCMNGACDMCFWCIEVTCTTIAIPGGGGTSGTTWPPDPPVNPPSSGGGGGGGGTNPPPSTNNCSGTNNCGQLRSLIVQGRVPCGGCGNGPIVVIPPDEPPIFNPVDTCLIANNAAKKMDTLYTKGKVDSMLNTIPGWQFLKFEKGFPIYKTYTHSANVNVSVTGYNPGAVQGSAASMSVNITFTLPALTRAAGQAHIHTDSGYAAPSAGDIFTLIENHNIFYNSNIKLQYEGSIIAAFDNSKYAITITNTSQAMLFSSTKNSNLDITTGDWKKGSTLLLEAQKVFDYYFLRDSTLPEPKRTDKAYELSQAAMLTKHNTGIILLKKDITGHFKPIIVDTYINPADSTKLVCIQKCQ